MSHIELIFSDSIGHLPKLEFIQLVAPKYNRSQSKDLSMFLLDLQNMRQRFEPCLQEWYLHCHYQQQFAELYLYWHLHLLLLREYKYDNKEVASTSICKSEFWS
eukprot:m.47266 g.47266  ORF g.47266 m.47266 type:complete len:104 (+) comp10473_c0_seq2:99-410(+)